MLVPATFLALLPDQLLQEAVSPALQLTGPVARHLPARQLELETAAARALGLGAREEELPRPAVAEPPAAARVSSLAGEHHVSLGNPVRHLEGIPGGVPRRLFQEARDDRQRGTR